MPNIALDQPLRPEPVFEPFKATDCPRCGAERIVAELFTYRGYGCETCFATCVRDILKDNREAAAERWKRLEEVAKRFAWEK